MARAHGMACGTARGLASASRSLTGVSHDISADRVDTDATILASEHSTLRGAAASRAALPGCLAPLPDTFQGPLFSTGAPSREMPDSAQCHNVDERPNPRIESQLRPCRYRRRRPTSRPSRIGASASGTLSVATIGSWGGRRSRCVKLHIGDTTATHFPPKKCPSHR